MSAGAAPAAAASNGAPAPSSSAAAPAAAPAEPASSDKPARTRGRSGAGGAPAAAPAEPAAAEPATAAAVEEERRLAKLMQRHQSLELAHRKEAKARADLEAKLAAYEAKQAEFDKRFQENPYGVLKERGVGSEEWAKAFLKQDDGPKVPPEVAKRLEELENRYKQQDADRTAATEQAERAQYYTAIRDAMSKRPELAFSARLGQHEKVADKISAHRGEYGDCTAADQLRIAQEIESETRQAVSDMLDKLAGSAGLAELLQKHAARAAEVSQAAEPGGSVSEPAKSARPTGDPGKPQGTNARRKALTRAQAAQVTARNTAGPRSRQDSKAAALKRLEDRARART